MTELRKVQTSQIDEKCPSCNSGWMRPTGIIKQTNPPKYEHKCTKCGYTADYGIKYPYILQE